MSAAAASRGETHNPFPSSALERRVAKFLTRFPKRVQNRLLEIMLGMRGVSPSLAEAIDPEELCAWLLTKGYPQEQENKYPLIFVGAPSGAGAMLAALYRCPLITDRFLISFKSKNHPDDAEAYARNGEALARHFAGDDKLKCIVHYDPLHDRFLIKNVTHLRFRLTSPLSAMREFIKQRLAPGGRVVLLQCGYKWPQYELENGAQMQVGGLGGIPAEEFTSDSDRLRAFRRASGGRADSAWNLERHISVQPESEWGSEPEFARELKSFCHEENIGIDMLDFEHPHQLSEIALRAHKLHFTHCRMKVRGLYVSCFTNVDAGFAMDTGLLPLWLPFNCEDSFEFLKKMAVRMLPHWDVWIALHPSFCQPPDLVDIRRWRKSLEKFAGLHWLGTDPTRHPSDVMSYFHFFEQTTRLKKEQRVEIEPAKRIELLHEALESLDNDATLT